MRGAALQPLRLGADLFQLQSERVEFVGSERLLTKICVDGYYATNEQVGSNQSGERSRRGRRHNGKMAESVLGSERECLKVIGEPRCFPGEESTARSKAYMRRGHWLMTCCDVNMWC